MPLRSNLRIPGAEIKEVFKNGKRIKTPFFVLIFLPNKKKVSRFSVIVPNNAAETIVKKNRIKRKIWAELYKNIDLVSGQDIIIKITTNEVNKDYSIAEDIKNNLLKIKNR